MGICGTNMQFVRIHIFPHFWVKISSLFHGFWLTDQNVAIQMWVMLIGCYAEHNNWKGRISIKGWPEPMLASHGICLAQHQDGSPAWYKSSSLSSAPGKQPHLANACAWCWGHELEICLSRYQYCLKYQGYGLATKSQNIIIINNVMRCELNVFLWYWACHVFLDVLLSSNFLQKC